MRSMKSAMLVGTVGFTIGLVGLAFAFGALASQPAPETAFWALITAMASAVEVVAGFRLACACTEVQRYKTNPDSYDFEGGSMHS